MEQVIIALIKSVDVALTDVFMAVNMVLYFAELLNYYKYLHKCYYFYKYSDTIVSWCYVYSNYWRFSLTFLGSSCGAGTYFATEIDHAEGYATGRLILAKVLTGKFEVGKREMMRPVSSKNLDDGCHSTVDKCDKPSLFVVYHDAAAYPEYVIKLNWWAQSL